MRNNHCISSPITQMYLFQIHNDNVRIFLRMVHSNIFDSYKHS